MRINRDYILGILTAMLFSAIGMLVAAMLPSALWNPNVRYIVTDYGNTEQLCPGETSIFHVDVNVVQPSVIEVTSVFLDANTHENVNAFDPIDFSGTRVYPESTIIEQAVAWQVPMLSPGNYLRVTAAVSSFSDARPEFIVIPFSVKEGCQ